MMVDVTTCADCHFWGDKPVVGDDGRSWARCRKYGWLQANDFYCKDGSEDTEQKEGEMHGLQA